MSIPKWTVKDVQATENHELLLTFMDGKKGIFDFLPQLQKPFYEKLKNIAFFSTAHVEDGTVVWDDETDIAPEYLYENS